MTEKPTYEELEQSAKELDRIFNFSPDMIGSGNLDGYFTKINLSFIQLLGYIEAELIENPFISFIHEEDVEKTKAALVEAAMGRSHIYIDNRYKCKDGSYKWIEWKVLSIVKENKFIAVGRDITERKRKEEMLRESEEKFARFEKMESIGLMAGGVAHDLNNVLSGIVCYPELLLLELPEDSKLRKPIETIKVAGDRAVALVQDLLTVAGGVATTKEPLNLNELVQNYLYSREFKHLKQRYPSPTVRSNLNNELLNIMGSSVHLRKVVINLVSNASEAVDGSGNITISTFNRYLDKPLSGYADVNIGEYAILAVSDDGPGISADALERIFEPFYTRKVMGRSGTGLDLAVVWNIVRDHKGYIDVKTDENGTVFELYFPITRDERPVRDLPKSIKDCQGSGEAILIVDDDEIQREISCMLLDRLGYKTKAVSSGEEAVDYLKENTVDLLLLDMIMDPGINGRETYERALKIHPNQKAVIVSGFAETNEVYKAQNLGAGKFIKKPFTMERIGLVVKEELGK